MELKENVHYIPFLDSIPLPPVLWTTCTVCCWGWFGSSCPFGLNPLTIGLIGRSTNIRAVCTSEGDMHAAIDLTQAGSAHA